MWPAQQQGWHVQANPLSSFVPAESLLAEGGREGRNPCASPGNSSLNTARVKAGKEKKLLPSPAVSPFPLLLISDPKVEYYWSNILTPALSIEMNT